MTPIGTRAKKVSAETMQPLRSYDWPGNIREVKNIVERLMIMCSSDVVGVEDLPPQVFSDSGRQRLSLEGGVKLKELRERVERDYIEATLKRNGWNISQTAKELDVDRTNLHKKINYYGLSEKG